MEDGVIIGFYGRAGCSYASFVNAIGVYAKPFEDSFCDSTQGLFITHKVVENAGHEALRSLTFYSNKGKYGPFGNEIGTAGNEIGTAFSSLISDGKVVGFHGRSRSSSSAVALSSV
ncbi:hypothetical protein Q3G72_019793 [Acer saccharum]|nr:hypothetical protein Q3G72_019793 [Acer saccharum]